MKKKLVLIAMISVSILYGCSKGNSNTAIENNTEGKPIIEENVSENLNIDTNIKSSDEALTMLKDGNERFLNDKSELRNINQQRRDQLKEGQNPYAVIVSCSDSRVTPTTIFNAGLGEIFDIRIAGNVVDDDALGSIEYAIEHCNTPLIVVIGHQSCGAVTAAYNKVIKGEALEGHIEDIVEKIEPSIDKNATLDDAINKNIEATIKKIFVDESIKKFIDEGKVKIVGAYYDLGGKVTFK